MGTGVASINAFTADQAGLRSPSQRCRPWQTFASGNLHSTDIAIGPSNPSARNAAMVAA